MAIYLMWSVLPFALLMVSIWALFKKTFGVAGREYSGEYFTQFVFCTLLYIAAIYADLNFYDDLAGSSGWSDFDTIGFAKFLIYPAFLLLGAKIQAIVLKEDLKKRPSSLTGRVAP